MRSTRAPEPAHNPGDDTASHPASDTAPETAPDAVLTSLAPSPLPPSTSSPLLPSTSLPLDGAPAPASPPRPAVAAEPAAAPAASVGHRWHGPGMVLRAFDGGRRAPLATLLALAVLAAAIAPMLARRLDWYPWFRMSDLEVYRAAGESLLQGRPLYAYLTPVPQLLPFTYPPFSATIAMPLALMSATQANWVWTLGTLAVLGWLVLVAFRPFARRFSPSVRPFVVVGALIAMAYTLPIRDCFHFGQVGIFLAALCLLDCLLPKTRWPRGLMIGFAAAIKLVPGVFIPYLWITGRRRAAAVATAWFVGLTVATAIAMPEASKRYWTSTLFQSGRLGDNAGTSNQAIRGFFLRVLPGMGGSVLWFACVLVVVVVGYRWARSASLSGFELRGVAIVGLLSVLVSPVSWIHHLAGWVPLAIGALLGDARADGRVAWRRVAYAVVGTAFFTLNLPWWGAEVAAKAAMWHIPGLILQDAFGLGALIVVWLLGRMGARSKGQTSATGDPSLVRG